MYDNYIKQMILRIKDNDCKDVSDVKGLDHNQIIMIMIINNNNNNKLKRKLNSRVDRVNWGKYVTHWV